MQVSWLQGHGDHSSRQEQQLRRVQWGKAHILLPADAAGSCTYASCQQAPAAGHAGRQRLTVLAAFAALTVMTGAGSSLPSSPRNCSALKMGAPSPSLLSLNSCTAQQPQHRWSDVPRSQAGHILHMCTTPAAVLLAHAAGSLTSHTIHAQLCSAGSSALPVPPVGTCSSIVRCAGLRFALSPLLIACQALPRPLQPPPPHRPATHRRHQGCPGWRSGPQRRWQLAPHRCWCGEVRCRCSRACRVSAGGSSGMLSASSRLVCLPARVHTSG
jgi:hypothetical protein